MGSTKLQIVNAASRSLGGPALTAIDSTTDLGKIITDIYDPIFSEVISAHPWNFALQRATLTVLGGLVTTWTASGTADVWQATLATEPSSVTLDGVTGTEKASVVACTAEGYWYWASNVLYVYSASDPDTAYTDPGINAVIPEFDYNYAYSLPSDCLRVVRMNDNAIFKIEGQRLLTDETEAKILYIKLVALVGTTTAEEFLSPACVTALVARLAVEISFPLTNNPALGGEKYKEYLDKLALAKSINAQEGTREPVEDSSWLDERV